MPIIGLLKYYNYMKYPKSHQYYLKVNEKIGSQNESNWEEKTSRDRRDQNKMGYISKGFPIIVSILYWI